MFCCWSAKSCNFNLRIMLPGYVNRLLVGNRPPAILFNCVKYDSLIYGWALSRRTLEKSSSCRSEKSHRRNSKFCPQKPTRDQMPERRCTTPTLSNQSVPASNRRVMVGGPRAPKSFPAPPQSGELRHDHPAPSSNNRDGQDHWLAFCQTGLTPEQSGSIVGRLPSRPS
jgi:hypothetical protein